MPWAAPWDGPSHGGPGISTPGAVRGCVFERDEVGADLFRTACGMGLEGLESKLRERAYRAGRSPRWIKIENRQHPLMDREL